MLEEVKSQGWGASGAGGPGFRVESKAQGSQAPSDPVDPPIRNAPTLSAVCVLLALLPALQVDSAAGVRALEILKHLMRYAQIDDYDNSNL